MHPSQAVIRDSGHGWRPRSSADDDRRAIRDGDGNPVRPRTPAIR
jgi:hypothetical protein